MNIPTNEAQRRAWRAARRSGDLSDDVAQAMPDTSELLEETSPSAVTGLGATAVNEVAPSRPSLFGPKSEESAPVSSKKPKASPGLNRFKEMAGNLDDLPTRTLATTAVSPPIGDLQPINENQTTEIPGQTPVGQGVVPPLKWDPPEN